MVRLGGIGGCPYAKGASGNLPLEDLIYVLSREKACDTTIFSQINEVILFLKECLELTIHGHISQILAKGGKLYGV